MVRIEFDEEAKEQYETVFEESEAEGFAGMWNDPVFRKELKSFMKAMTVTIGVATVKLGWYHYQAYRGQKA